MRVLGLLVGASLAFASELAEDDDTCSETQSLLQTRLVGRGHAQVSVGTGTKIAALNPTYLVADGEVCPSGHSEITDQGACEQSAGQLSSHPTWEGRRGWCGAQSGCITSGTGQVFWNRELTSSQCQGTPNAYNAGHPKMCTATPPASDPVSALYVVADGEVCPSGHSEITDQGACEQSAGQLSSHPTWEGRRGWCGAQSGCITSGHGQVFWNRELTSSQCQGTPNAYNAGHPKMCTATPPASDPVSVLYAVSDGQTCPPDHTEITDQGDCEQSAGQLPSHPTWEGRRGWCGAQSGCITSSHGQVFWNRELTSSQCQGTPNAYNAGHPRMCIASSSASRPVSDTPVAPPAAEDAGQPNNVWVDLHNEKRAGHGSCPVVWNEAVAAGMQEWVDGLTSLQHSNSYRLPSPQGPAGENLAWSSGAISEEQTVNMWYNEVNDCISLPGCEHGRNGRATGHFTAMVWKGVRSIGCAISSDGHFSGCRYRSGDRLSGDTANMGGNYENNVQPAGAGVVDCA